MTWISRDGYDHVTVTSASASEGGLGWTWRVAIVAWLACVGVAMALVARHPHMEVEGVEVSATNVRIARQLNRFANARFRQGLAEEVHETFPKELYFLGTLSDVAVYNYLQQTTFFAAFFPGGVRANNTSVASAMEFGSVVLTNLDEHSPPELVHMDNVIDIERCDELPSDRAVLERLGRRATETARARDWNALVDRLQACR